MSQTTSTEDVGMLRIASVPEASQLASIQTGVSSYYKVPPYLLTFLSDQIEACRLQHIVVLSDPDMPDAQAKFVDTFLTWSVPFSHFTIPEKWGKEELADFLHECYWDRKFYNFIVFSAKSVDIVTEANNLFVDQFPVSLIPNRLKFILLEDISVTAQKLSSLAATLFDSVSVVEFSRPSLTLASARTLMWRKERRREFDVVDVYSKPTKCAIFPNLDRKLNGRVLRALMKEYTYEVQKTISTPTNPNSHPYEGFSVAIVDMLAKSLNFSYVCWPEVAVADNMSWLEVSNSLAEHKADLSIPGWGMSSQYLLNHSIAYPVLSDHLTGVYISSSTTGPLESTITRLFQPAVNMAFLASFLATLVLTVILAFSSPVPDKGGPKARQEETNFHCSDVTAHGHSEEFEEELRVATPVREINTASPRKFVDLNVELEKSPHRDCNNSDTIPTISITSAPSEPSTTSTSISRKQYVSRLRAIQSYIVDTAFALFGSILQQDTLPNARPMSLRFLLWGWALTVLVITSYYKGSLTADKIQPSPPTPFTTFEEILTHKDFRFCMPTDYVTYESAMKNADKDSVLYRLYERMPHLRSPIPGFCNNLDEVATFLKSGGKVMAIAIRDDLKRVALSRNVTDVVFLNEDLVHTAVGMAMPKDSELTELFSAQLQQYIEQGIIEFLYNKWGGVNKTNVIMAQKTTGNDANRRPQVKDMAWVFYWCGIGTAISLATLIGEHLVTYIALRLWPQLAA